MELRSELEQHNNDDIVIIIPCFNPDEKFTDFLSKLKSNSYNNIIVVNDGSLPEKKCYFDKAEQVYGCKLITHSINLGQGRAYKTGFNYYLNNANRGGDYEDSIGVIQCDCDGQHDVSDINRCAELLRRNPRKFILGVRDFSDKEIPFRSRFGNKITSVVFKLFCAIDIQDTQSGLKGIPGYIIPRLMEVPGERFEYASSVLIDTQRSGVEILSFPIKTIYINGNETSHFNPVVDSIRIYSLILRYLMSSLSSFVLDIILYSLFIGMFRNAFPEYYIMISTYLSRIILCVYVFFFNKKAVFHNNEKTVNVAVKFFSLCVVQATVSGLAVRSLMHILPGREIIGKIIVDTLLFFVSFQIQSRWVFKNKPAQEVGEDG